MWCPLDLLSKDGYDLQWATNVVGPFLLTELLAPALAAGAQGAPDRHARVVVTSSSGAYSETLHWDTFRDGPARRKMSTEALYYQSKHVRRLGLGLRVGRAGADEMGAGERRRRAADGEAVCGEGHHRDIR